MMKGKKLLAVVMAVVFAMAGTLSDNVWIARAEGETRILAITFQGSSGGGHVEWSNDGSGWTSEMAEHTVTVNDTAYVKIVPDSGKELDPTALYYQIDGSDQVNISSGDDTSLRDALTSDEGLCISPTNVDGKTTLVVNTGVKLTIGGVEFRNAGPSGGGEGGPGTGGRTITVGLIPDLSGYADDATNFGFEADVVQSDGGRIGGSGGISFSKTNSSSKSAVVNIPSAATAFKFKLQEAGQKVDSAAYIINGDTTNKVDLDAAGISELVSGSGYSVSITAEMNTVDWNIKIVPQSSSGPSSGEGGEGGGSHQDPPPSGPTVEASFAFSPSGLLENLFVDGSSIGNNSGNLSIPTLASEQTTREMVFQAEFGKAFGKITINGTDYTPARGLEDKYTISNVPVNIVSEVETYNVVFTEAESNVATIIWSTDPHDNVKEEIDPTFNETTYVANGRVEIVSIKRGDVTLYDAATMGAVEEGKRKYNDQAAEVSVDVPNDGFGRGYVTFQKGDNIVLKLIPNYGYQVGVATVNGVTLTPNGVDWANVSTYKLDDIQGNLHFSGSFTAVANTINESAANVNGAAIGKGENAADSGTLKLTINDNVSYSTEQQNAALNKVGGGVAHATTVATLDMTLDQLVRQGTSDTNWTNNITNFSDNIDVTIDLTEVTLGGGKMLKVVRDHNGTLEVVGSSATADNITIQTNQFSTYSLVEVDMPSYGDVDQSKYSPDSEGGMNYNIPEGKYGTITVPAGYNLTIDNVKVLADKVVLNDGAGLNILETGALNTAAIEINGSPRMMLGSNKNIPVVASESIDVYDLRDIYSSIKGDTLWGWFSFYYDTVVQKWITHIPWDEETAGDPTAKGKIEHYIYAYSDLNNDSSVNEADMKIGLAVELSSKYFWDEGSVLDGQYGIHSPKEIADRMTITSAAQDITAKNKSDGNVTVTTFDYYIILGPNKKKPEEMITVSGKVYGLDSYKDILIYTGSEFYVRNIDSDKVANSSLASNMDEAVTVLGNFDLSKVAINGNGCGSEENVNPDNSAIYTIYLGNWKFRNYYNKYKALIGAGSAPSLEDSQELSGTVRIMKPAEKFVQISGVSSGTSFEGPSVSSDTICQVGDDMYTTVYVGYKSLEIASMASGLGLEAITDVTLADPTIAAGVEIIPDEGTGSFKVNFLSNYYDTIPLNITYSSGAVEKVTIYRSGLVIRYQFLGDPSEAPVGGIPIDNGNGHQYTPTYDYDNGQQVLVYAVYYHPLDAASQKVNLYLSYADGTSKVLSNGAKVAGDTNRANATVFPIDFYASKTKSADGKYRGYNLTTITAKPFSALVMNAGFDSKASFAGTQFGAGKGVEFDGNISWNFN